MNLLKQTKYIRTHEHILKSVCLKIGNNKYYEDEQEKGGGVCKLKQTRKFIHDLDR